MNDEFEITPAVLTALTQGDIGNALRAGMPGGIEAQEAAGQREFVASTTLPQECQGCTRVQLEQIGIEFGKNTDDLFVEVNLPDGWQKVPTDHSMWSKLIDGKGRERGSIFYKAAFYDRSAHMSICRRFSFGVEPQGGYANPGYIYDTTPRIAVVRDQSEIIWQSEPEAPSEEVPTYAAAERYLPDAEAWLVERCPDWRDPLAYWD